MNDTKSPLVASAHKDDPMNTPRCDLLLRNPLDSNDLRTWQSLAVTLERDFRHAHRYGDELHARLEAQEKQLTRLYEQDALHTEAEGMQRQMIESLRGRAEKAEYFAGAMAWMVPPDNRVGEIREAAERYRLATEYAERMKAALERIAFLTAASSDGHIANICSVALDALPPGLIDLERAKRGNEIGMSYDAWTATPEGAMALTIATRCYTYAEANKALRAAFAAGQRCHSQGSCNHKWATDGLGPTQCTRCGILATELTAESHQGDNEAGARVEQSRQEDK